jgi:hypothetical protein
LSGNDTVTDVDGCTDGARAVEALVQLPDNATFNRGANRTIVCVDRLVRHEVGVRSVNSTVPATAEPAKKITGQCLACFMPPQQEADADFLCRPLVSELPRREPHYRLRRSSRPS